MEENPVSYISWVQGTCIGSKFVSFVDCNYQIQAASSKKVVDG